MHISAINMYVWQYIVISIVYPSPGVHVHAASVLNEMCLCLSFICDQLPDYSSCVSWHMCLHLDLFGAMNKIKVDDSCVRRRLYQSLLNPEVPLTQFFGRQILYRGYICCWVCSQVWVGARARAYSWHRGIWYKAYKKSCLKERMFISFTNRMSSSPPAESEKDVMSFVPCAFFGVCFCLCKSVWNGEAT